MTAPELPPRFLIRPGYHHDGVDFLSSSSGDWVRVADLPAYVAEVRRQALEEAASVAESPQIEAWYKSDDATAVAMNKILQHYFGQVAAAIRALKEQPNG